MTTALLRPARTADVPLVGDLHFRSRKAAYAHLLRPETLEFAGAGALAEWWVERRKWEQETHRLTVADVEGTIVGFTYVGPSPDEGVTELYAIHVDPAFVGTGVGRQLMEDALPHLGSRAVLWVLPGNERARRFYERGGWRADGETRVDRMGDEDVQHLRYTLDRSLDRSFDPS